MLNKGFTLIELLVALGLSALFLPALVFVFSFSLGAASQGESYTQAYALAQEQMEAIYYLKDNVGSDWDWTLTPVNTSPMEYYQPSKVSGSWKLDTTTTSPVKINGYTTTVQIFAVNRKDVDYDGIGDEIADMGIPDNFTRKVAVKVAWKEKGQDTSIDLVSYVSKH